jgi:hypothetical protein
MEKFGSGVIISDRNTRYWYIISRVLDLSSGPREALGSIGIAGSGSVFIE